MPKKLNPESSAEQSKRFKREAQKLIDAGELSLTDADAAMDKLIRNPRLLRPDFTSASSAASASVGFSVPSSISF